LPFGIVQKELLNIAFFGPQSGGLIGGYYTYKQGWTRGYINPVLLPLKKYMFSENI